METAEPGEHEMAITWNLKKTSAYVGDCSICRESISVGFYYRNGSSLRHSACHADPAAHAPVAAAAPIATRPASSAPSTFRRCPRCGAGGHTGNYPFSTCPDVACDDCL